MHDAEGARWRTSPSKNRLATCGDIVVALYRSTHGVDISSIDAALPRARALKSGLDSFFGGGGATDTVSAREAAATICVLTPSILAR